MKYVLAFTISAFLFSCSSADHGLHSNQCAKKKRDYAKNGINGQKAMVGW